MGFFAFGVVKEFLHNHNVAGLFERYADMFWDNFLALKYHFRQDVF
ncbi:hypothetical protein CRENPOLYSF1_250005 [Crenothrix polyspora]|uniref:Uncharacterized protein n=1 Tax=Crenothrix polyspora TaxID=360316 RepID=A0A1R4H823_9GAMM|nr:hypothetical protein CRENPOLYSF1_250005 [Crenothrix polyspora]